LKLFVRIALASLVLAWTSWRRRVCRQLRDL